MIDTRLFYKKVGRIKYISHLDMNRLMQRALKRSGLPVWYTQGFNPHMYMTFAMPLSLGFESECEILDFRLNEAIPGEEVARRLGEQMPAGLEITRVGAPQMDIHAIAFCDYRITLEVPDPAAALAQLGTLMEGDSLEAEKKTKRGIQRIDLLPHIGLLGATAEEGMISFDLRCASGTQLNINPSLVVGAFCDRQGYDPLAASYRKTAVLTDGLELFR